MYLFKTLLLILSFTLLAACGKKEAEKAPAAGGKNAPVLAEYVVVSPKALENKIIATGTLLANEEVELRAEINGRITALQFQEGGFVKKNTVMVKINDEDLKAQYRKTEVNIKTAVEDEKRAAKLLAIQGISQEDYDAVQNRLATLKAEAEYQRTLLAKTEISAPFDGIVGLRNVSVGGYLTPNTLITSIQQMDPIKVEFSIPEKYGKYVRVGSPIRFTVQGDSTVYQAAIYAIDPGIDVATRSIKLRARTANPAFKLRPGAFAKVELELERIMDAIALPSQAIIPELGGQKVYRLKGGKAEAVKIEVGIRTESEVQVTQGLQNGDTILTTGIMQLKPGSPVLLK